MESMHHYSGKTLCEILKINGSAVIVQDYYFNGETYNYLRPNLEGSSLDTYQVAIFKIKLKK